jgi:integrase
MRETKPDGNPYSPTTIHNRTRLTLRFLAWVYRRIGRDRSHLDDVTVPSKAQVKKGRALSPEEAQGFLEALRDRNPLAHVLTLTLLITGQRWGSVSALRWEDVDLDEKVMTFAQSHYRGKVKARNKSGKVVRLPIPDALSEALTEHRARMLRTQHPNISTGLVFPTDRPAETSTTGGYRCAGDIRTLYHNAAVEAGIETPTPHDLRRTAITWLVDAGISGTVVRAIAGHSRAAMTDHYYRGNTDAKRSSLEHIAGVIQPG